MPKAKTNDNVQVHYTGRLNSGEVFDSSEGREPLEFTIGAGQVIPGFEDAVTGMEPDESKTIHIPFAQAYGDVKDELIQEISNNHLPDGLEPKTGMQLVSKTETGQEVRVRVKEVKEETIVVDANHPLAGEDLQFEIRLVEIS